MSFRVRDQGFNPCEGKGNTNICRHYYHWREIKILMRAYLRMGNLKFCNLLDGTGIRLGFCRYCQTFLDSIGWNYLAQFWGFSYSKNTRSRSSTQDCIQSTVSALHLINQLKTFSFFYRAQCDTNYS